MKTNLLVLLLLLGVPTSRADTRITAEGQRIRSLSLAVEMYYKDHNKAPRSWEDLRGLLIAPAEDVELLRRQFLFVGVEGHDPRYPDSPPRDLLLVSVYPNQVKTSGAPPEKWYTIWKSNMISGNWVHAKEIQHFSGWPEVQQKIMARRAELAAAPAGVAPPVKSTFADEVLPPRGQTVSLAAQQAAKQAKQSRQASKSAGAPTERASRGAHPALFAALGIGALLIAFLVGRRMLWRNTRRAH